MAGRLPRRHFGTNGCCRHASAAYLGGARSQPAPAVAARPGEPEPTIGQDRRPPMMLPSLARTPSELR